MFWVKKNFKVRRQKSKLKKKDFQGLLGILESAEFLLWTFLARLETLELVTLV